MTTEPSVQIEQRAVGRGSTSVCIPLVGEPEAVFQCLRNAVVNTPLDSQIVVACAPGIDPAVERFVSDLDRELVVVETASASGGVTLANRAIASCGEADVALLAAHALVFEGWLGRARQAGRSDSTIATACAFGADAGPLTVRSPGPKIDAELAARIAARSLRVTPRTITAEGDFVWISRAAVELIGSLDDAFETLRAAIIDFSQRCARRGMLNVVIDDLYVASALQQSDSAVLPANPDRELLERRYPYLAPYLDDTTIERSPLRRSRAVARQAVAKTSVLIDARIVRKQFTGPQAVTLELIGALAENADIDLRLLIDPQIERETWAAIERIAGDAELILADQVGAGTPVSDLVHRPYQVSSAADLELLMGLGERLVITQLDLIGFHNPVYFDSYETWQQFRRVTRDALAIADQVIFNSEHALEDGVREGLVERERARVISLAVERRSDNVKQKRPKKLPAGDFVLCLGNDFLHKNRMFAIRLATELHEIGWQGQLVLAGADVSRGSSRGDEAAYLATHPEVAPLVCELASVGEAEKNWLYTHAAAVLYPSVYEGFGLIPFEAQRAGVPCLFAAQASLGELLPADAAVLVPWDPVASAHRSLPLLREGPERERHLELLSAASEVLPDWNSIADQVRDVYEQAARAPFREAAVLAAEGQAREAALGRWAIGLEREIGTVIGPDAYLPSDVQRALLAIANRKRLRRPVFALLRLIYRIGHRERR